MTVINFACTCSRSETVLPHCSEVGVMKVNNSESDGSMRSDRIEAGTLDIRAGLQQTVCARENQHAAAC